jgi:hypothetical protein
MHRLQSEDKDRIRVSASPSTTPAIVQRCLIAGLIVSIIATAGIGIVMIVAFADASERTAGMLIGAPAILSLCFALLVVFSAVLRRKCPRGVGTLATLGGILTAASTTLVLGLLLLPESGDHDTDAAMAKAGTGGFAIAIALAYTCALSLMRTHSWLVRAMAISTLLSVWSAAGLLMFMLIALEALNIDHDFEVLIALSITWSILALLTLIGTVAVPIAVVSKASKKQQAPESIDPRVQVHFGCPKCGERQTHRPGFVHCSKCGTGMFIEIEEPRCECGYLLYQLTGDACPECGRPVVSPVRS